MVIAFDLAKVAIIKQIGIGPAIAVRAQRPVWLTPTESVRNGPVWSTLT